MKNPYFGRVLTAMVTPFAADGIPMYQNFIAHLEQTFGKPIATGEFGANMQVALVNDGPVTIIIDSKNRI